MTEDQKHEEDINILELMRNGYTRERAEEIAKEGTGIHRKEKE